MSSLRLHHEGAEDRAQLSHSYFFFSATLSLHCPLFQLEDSFFSLGRKVTYVGLNLSVSPPGF